MCQCQTCGFRGCGFDECPQCGSVMGRTKEKVFLSGSRRSVRLYNKRLESGVCDDVA